MERIKVKDAAAELGVSEQFVRIGMQRGTLPIGSCVKISNRWNYCIPRARFEAYLQGKDLQTKKEPPAATGDSNRCQ